MATFLFWNINNKPLRESIANLASLYEIDVVMLVECSTGPAELLDALNQDGIPSYHYAPGIGCRKVEIFARFPGTFLPPVLEAARLTIRHLKLPGQTSVLLAVTHFPSKRYWDDESQALECAHLSDMIREAEMQVGHSRTMLVGDLNMNPFETGVVSAGGLHAVMSKGTAKRVERTVQGKKYPMFYNPMWGLFGDAENGPPGTYYYDSAKPKVFFWNMFDQVMVRPGLLDHFSSADLRILESDGEFSFMSPGNVPGGGSSSDHLPIVFSLNL